MQIRACLVVATAWLAGPAWAQSNPADFIGSWQADTGQMSGPCSLDLRNSTGMVGLSAASQFCLGPLAFLNGWRPETNGVSLLGLMGDVIGTLTVSRGQLQGRLSDGTIITMTPTSGQTLTAGTSGSNCFHNPDSGYCADPGEVAVPTAYPVTVKALHPLAIRQEPTAQSQSLGTIADGQCFIVEGCTQTNEGTKCRIPAGTGIAQGWASKHFLQDGTWFVGFQNFC